jgi:hypothetical protein
MIAPFDFVRLWSAQTPNFHSSEERAMKRTLPFWMAVIALSLAVVGLRASSAQDNQNKYTLSIPGGIAFSDFKGYEDWQAVSPTLTDAQNVIRLIVANPVMINAYKQGVPANGNPFPDGSRIAKIEWRPKKLTSPPFSANTPDTVPGELVQVELIEKDSKKFTDSHGWGYGMFDYDAASGSFKPATLSSKPPVGHDAKCGAACHELAGASKDYIFTPYAKR